MPMPQMNMPMQNQQQMGAPNQDPKAQAYYANTLKIVPSVKAENPHLKTQVGNAIFDFVTQLSTQ